jgi:hypothetical protein
VGTFSGPGELADRLVESGELEACVTRQYLTFAYGRPLTTADDEAVAHVLAAFTDADLDFRQLLVDLVADDTFGFRREPGT